MFQAIGFVLALAFIAYTICSSSETEKESEMKSWFKSKTIWFNVLSAALLVLNGASQVITDPKTLAAISVAIGSINVVLRLFTSEPVTGR